MLLNGPAADSSRNYFDKFRRLKRSVSEGRDIVRGVPLTEGVPSVWAMEYADGYLVLGCSNGRIEIWDTSNSSIKVLTFIIYFIKML